jgi:uncharacterized membrane protein
LEEREEALKYYEGYFDDAGSDNEQDVVRELVSPERIANIIKRDLQGGARFDDKEYTERGYREGGEEDGYEVSLGTADDKSRNQGSGTDGAKIALIILAGILLSPFLFGGFGVFLGLIATFFGLFIAGAALALAFTVGGIAVICFGFVNMITTSVALGVLLLGIGLLMLGFGILFILLNIWLWGDLLPTIIRWTVNTFNRLVHKKEVQ